MDSLALSITLLLLIEAHQVRGALALPPGEFEQLPRIRPEIDVRCSIDFTNSRVLGFEPLYPQLLLDCQPSFSLGKVNLRADRA